MSTLEEAATGPRFNLGFLEFSYFFLIFFSVLFFNDLVKLKTLAGEMLGNLLSCCRIRPEPELEEEGANELSTTDADQEPQKIENLASWGDTFSNISEFTYVWTIHNFSHHPRTSGEYLDSPPFYDNDGRTKWNLRLYPGGRGPEHKDHISLHLCLLSSNILRDGFSLSKEVNAKLRVSVLNEEKLPIWEISFTGTRGFQPKNAGTNWGWHKFLSHELVYDSVKGYLPGDKLILKSDVSMVASVTATAGVLPSPPSTLAYDLSQILNDMKFSDVTLKAQGRVFKGHRVILAARSPVFGAMFSHNMQESKNSEVIIQDIDSEVVEELLRFIYTNKVNGLNKFAKRLLAAADKYALESLKTVCESALICQLTVENVSEFLILADLHRCKHLKDAALSTVRRMPDKIVKTSGWTELVESYPALVSEIITSQHNVMNCPLEIAAGDAATYGGAGLHEVSNLTQPI